MKTLDVSLIKEAVYNLCVNANVYLPQDVYQKLKMAYNKASSKIMWANILENARVAAETKRPLCQDTGNVIIFMSIGQDVHIEGGELAEAVNGAVEKAYKENYFRKSIVKNAIFDRGNTGSNTPCVLHTEIVSGDSVQISVLIKGAGSENKSKAEMLLPTSSLEEIKEFVAAKVLESGINSCPPLYIGVGFGGTIDTASLLAKKALLEGEKTQEIKDFALDIKNIINQKAPEEFEGNYVLDLNIITVPTHIACLPVGVSINCHSMRKASCVIENSNIEYLDIYPEYEKFDIENVSGIKINTAQKDEIRNLKQGENVLLSGRIYVARDAAHKRLKQMIDKNERLPFEIKDSIIFYAGPCPPKEGEKIGPIGPTTASRMDKFAVEFYDKGLLATIGKGERGKDIQSAIVKNNAVYFTLQGGIASLIASKVKSSNIIAFEDLGAEAIYELEVQYLPLRVEISG